MVVANQIDCVAEPFALKSMITKIQKFAKKRGCLFSIASAKTGDGVNSAFSLLFKHMQSRGLVFDVNSTSLSAKLNKEFRA